MSETLPDTPMAALGWVATLDGMVTSVALILLLVLTLALVGAAFRMIVGPGHADRFIALDMLTGLAVAACGSPPS